VRIGVLCLAGPHLYGAQASLLPSSKENASHAHICSSRRRILLAESRVPPSRASVPIVNSRFSHEPSNKFAATPEICGEGDPAI
jgi:hypothetical protein